MSTVSVNFHQQAVDLDRNYLPHLSVNGVIFGLPPLDAEGGELRVLIMRVFPDAPWGLPSAYIPQTLSLDEAANGAFSELLGINTLSLSQIGAFGEPDRISARKFVDYFARKTGISRDHWIFGRVVSIAYTALVRVEETQVKVPNGIEEYQWVSVDELPDLMLDHADMVHKALAFIRQNISTLNLGSLFDSGEFTMPQLRTLHETVFGQPLDRRNFQKQMLDTNLVERLDGKLTKGQGRPAFVYRWKGRREA